MAIKRIKFDQLEGTVTITNGDFQALKKIARDYNITNEEDVITFAIGVLSEANGRPVAVEKVDGTIAKFLPAEKLKTNQWCMTGETLNTSSIVVDEEYKSAIQPYVDNTMRTDILGPHFCRVLENHTPASRAIIALMVKQIVSDPELKKSVKTVVGEYNQESKMKWVNIAVGAFGTIAVAMIIWGVQYLITHPKNTLQTTNASSIKIAVK